MFTRNYLKMAVHDQVPIAHRLYLKMRKSGLRKLHGNFFRAIRREE